MKNYFSLTPLEKSIIKLFSLSSRKRRTPYASEAAIYSHLDERKYNLDDVAMAINNLEQLGIVEKHQNSVGCL